MVTDLRYHDPFGLFLYLMIKITFI